MIGQHFLERFVLGAIHGVHFVDSSDDRFALSCRSFGDEPNVIVNTLDADMNAFDATVKTLNATVKTLDVTVKAFDATVNAIDAALNTRDEFMHFATEPLHSTVVAAVRLWHTTTLPSS